jgi:CHAT domain-containing protein
VIERSLDYSATGTLWTAYGRDGAALRSAELWSAGDIAVGAHLRLLGIAFLSACETGSGGFEPMIDEYGGLPAALLLAGAGAVVCSLWPVPESLTLLAADLFYGHLAAAGDRFDVVAAVRACGRELRELSRDAARTRLLALRERTADPAARFMLEATAWRLRNGPEHPYARPVHWAAFFAVGAPQIRFASARRGRA